MVIEAVLELIGSGISLGSLSLIGIARHTGISRNAIYRRWKSKEDLYLDVLMTIDHDVPEPNAQSARENLVELMNALAERIADPRVGQMERAVNAEERDFPELQKYLENELVTPFTQAMKSLIRRGKETGEIRVDVNEDVLTYVLLSASASPKSLGTIIDIDSDYQHIADLLFQGVAPQ